MEYRKKAFWIYLSSGVLAALLVAYGALLVTQLRDAREIWLDYSQRAVLADEALHQFSLSFGYGGFIHHFKNYVLRQDPELLSSLRDSIAQTRQSIAAYQSLAVTADERDALVRLAGVVEEYAAKLARAQTLVGEGLSPAAIDRRVAVDDGPALAALQILSQQAEFQAISQRQAVGNQLETVTLQIAYGGVLVVLILVVAAVLVDDRRRLAQASSHIAETRRYFIDLLEAAPDAILVVDHEGRIMRANLQAEQLFGYSREDLLTKRVEELMPERFREGHKQIRQRAYSLSSTRAFGSSSEFTILTRDGRELEVEISLGYSEQGEGRQAIVSLRDMSERRLLERKLKEQHEALQAAQAITHLGSWDWDVETDTLTWSDEAYRIFGFEAQAFAVSYPSFLDLVHPLDRDKVQRAVKQAIELGEAYDVEHRIRHADGGERIVKEQGRVFRDDTGAARRMVGTILDITEQKLYERALKLDQAIIDRISQPIVVTDQHGDILDINEAFSEMTGYETVELVGQNTRMLKSGRHDDAYYAAMWQAIEAENHWQGEMWLRRKDGEGIHRLLAITRVCDEELDECRYVGLYSDISQIKAHEAELEHLAHFDHLTGLPNRILCHDRLRATLARARRAKTLAAVFYLDLDGFKPVNDTLGHQAGDELLVEVAKHLSHCVREEDTVARLGGDEFVIVLGEVSSRDEVAELAARVLKQLQVEVPNGDGSLAISGSLGIALYPDDGVEMDALLANADQAMYQAKAWGRNRFVFYDQA